MNKPGAGGAALLPVTQDRRAPGVASA